MKLNQILVTIMLCVVFRSVASEVVKYPVLRPATVNMGELMQYDREEGRIFFDAIANFISTSEWFPLELNVPDTLAGVVQGVGSMWSGLMDMFGPNQNLPRLLRKLTKSLETFF